MQRKSLCADMEPGLERLLSFHPRRLPSAQRHYRLLCLLFSSFDDIRTVLAVIGTFLSVCSSCCCLLLSSLASSVLRRCGKHRVLSFPLSPAQVATAADDLPLDNFVCDEHSDSECGLMPLKLATCEPPPFGSPLLR